jgi:hypothetical protein
MGGYLRPEELRALLDSGLRLCDTRAAGAADPVRSVEAHEFIVACVEHAIALEMLESLARSGAKAPLAS